MNAIRRDEDGSVTGWHNREAKDRALHQVPPDAVVVVDVSMTAKYPVRSAFERYGAAVFFDANRKAIAIWIDHDEEMVYPPKETPEHRLVPEARDWEFAQWRFRVSVYFQGFAVGHLVTVHWGMSNTLVVSARESLDPHHPLREPHHRPFLARRYHNQQGCSSEPGISSRSYCTNWRIATWRLFRAANW